MNPKINLGEISIDAFHYAVSANAVLGTRGAGKTFTGKYLAESLMDLNIPVIIIDPMGKWRYMKEANPNRTDGKSYPVIVVGKNADVELSTETIESVVITALETRSSLVIDLFDMDYFEIKDEIVTTIVKTLLYQNDKYGLRHIIFEEAADFFHQYGRKTEANTWGEILTRYSGNVKVGVTFINQNAESLSKSILKLCHGMILGKQNESNSIKMIRKWLGGGGVGNSAEIASSLPSLKAGQFWVWSTNINSNPVLTHIPNIRSNHPSRNDMTPDDIRKSDDTLAVIELMRDTEYRQDTRIWSGLDMYPQLFSFTEEIERDEFDFFLDVSGLSGDEQWTVSQAEKTSYGVGTVRSNIDDLIRKGFTKLEDKILKDSTGRTFVLYSDLENRYAEIVLREYFLRLLHEN